MAAVGPESLYTNAAVERADAGRSRPSGRRSSCTAPRRSCARSIPSAGPCSAGGIRHRPRRTCRRAPYRDGWRRGSCRPLRGADRGVPRRSHSIVELGSSHSGKFGRPTMGSSGAIQINPKRSPIANGVRADARAGMVASGPSAGIPTHVRPHRTSSRSRRIAGSRRRRYRCSTAQGIRAAIGEGDEAAVQPGQRPTFTEQFDRYRPLGNLVTGGHGVPRTGEYDRFVRRSGRPVQLP